MPLREQERFVCHGWGRGALGDHMTLESQGPESTEGTSARPTPALGDWELQARKLLLSVQDLSMSYLTLFTFYLKNGYSEC